MKPITNFKICLIVITVLFSTSCEKTLTGSGPDLSESLDPVEEVQLIQGGENATITVNKSQTAYFNIEFRDIKPNNIIDNGFSSGWCIDWEKAINSNNGTYSAITLHSTDLVEKWKPVNYLLNIEQDLRNNDPDLTWREIQIVLWSLRANPEFKLEKVAVEDLPADFRTNGQPNFDSEKVRQILNMVESGYKDFSFSPRTKFAVIAETPADVQTVITVVEKK